MTNAAAAARGTLFTLVLRIFSFLSSQITFRLVDVASLGKASIELELISSTILFFSREGFRLALTKQEYATPQLWNTAWCTVIAHSILAFLGATWLLYSYSSNNNNNDPNNDDNDNYIDTDYQIAGLLYCTAAWIEGWAEPRVLWCLRTLNISTKASAEGIGTLIKTLSTVTCLLAYPTYPVTAFGIGQLSYALGLNLFLFRATPNVPYPSFKDGLDYPTLKLTGIFTLQGILKHLLTEGDRIVLSTLANHYHQGIYAIASAYGGMAARLLLQPLEENARLLWTRPQKNLRQSYTCVVKAVLYVGAVFTFLAVNYTSVLLTIVGQPREAAGVLSAFCVYTGVLAWNGMTEALVYAITTTGTDIGKLSAAHTMVGAVFGGLAPVLVARYSTVGLVTANGVCMCLRIGYSIQFAAHHLSVGTEKVGSMTLVRDMVPHPIVLASFVTSYGATRFSLGRLQTYESTLVDGTISLRNTDWLLHASQHILVGIISLMVIMVVAMTREGNFRKQLRDLVKDRTD